MQLSINILAIAIIVTSISSCNLSRHINILEQRIQILEQERSHANL